VSSTVVLDTAGAAVGGAARWIAELDAYLAAGGTAVTVIGRGTPLTPRWLLHRELAAHGADMVVAANNASFALRRAHRRVLLRNALHFLHPGEEHLLTGMSRAFHAQIPVVRQLSRRADDIVVPSSAMAERVCSRLPHVRDRVRVRAHPVTAFGSRIPSAEPFVLVPVLPAPYKNLVVELRGLLAALAATGRGLPLHVTARPDDLPPDLAGHPLITVLGVLPPERLAHLWQQAAAVFFPSTVEAFGYPLAEARVHGVPVLAPDSAQAREIAGPALVPYRPGDPSSLADALSALDTPVPAQPLAFDRSAYFRWLLQIGDRDADD
jgi:glycosyltransferase involved in cell wall biosynthesis